MREEVTARAKERREAGARRPFYIIGGARFPHYAPFACPRPSSSSTPQLFVAAGLALALVTLWLRRDLRQNMINMSIAMGVGLVGLVLLARYGVALTDATITSVVREALLLLVAIGFTRIALMFVFQAVLRRLAIPRILADVLIAVVLIVFAHRPDEGRRA